MESEESNVELFSCNYDTEFITMGPVVSKKIRDGVAERVNALPSIFNSGINSPTLSPGPGKPCIARIGGKKV